MKKVYNVGQKINLWQIYVDHTSRTTRVLKSVIVTITEEKTGVPGQWSRTPTESQSLKGVDDAGGEYTKHWESWPESQTNCFTDQWSFRDDGEPEPGDRDDFRFWFPKEAVTAYNTFLHYKKKGVVDQIVGPDGKEIVPLGDVVKCDKHGEYDFPPSGPCFSCIVEKLEAA